MTRNHELAELLIDIFGGNKYHARAAMAGTDIYYSPVEVPLSTENILKHLNGEICLGAYQLIAGSDVVRWLGFDVDSSDLETAREIVKKIQLRLTNIPHVVEFSGGKGYHVLIFLKSPMPAVKAKTIVDWVREAEGFATTGKIHVECFPKQDRLTKARPKGNLLKIPLGEHPRTHSRSVFVDPQNGWENGQLVDPIFALSEKASLDDVLSIIQEGATDEDQLVELLAQYWEAGKRHDMALFLSGYLAHESWGVEQAKDLVRRIVQYTGDDEEYNRLQTVETTFAKYREGKSIRGRQGLGEILPMSAMQRMTDLCNKMRSPDTVAQLDEIRYAKAKSNLDNARLASSTMWAILNDEGNKIFQTKSGLAYWYNSQTFMVMEESSEVWDAMLNKQFGMNPKDTFSRLATQELRLRIVRESPVISIENRTFWNQQEQKLYINLGGPEVYVLDGSTIEVSHNGECGIMFLSDPSGTFMVPNFNIEKVNCWDYLTNDLSFTITNDAPSRPDEQRELLKAWILALFFQELMPTKPILAMLGQPGSGKTTAIRRILRIFENPDSDVLGVPTDKQDAFRASIEAHRLLVLDNLEKSGTYWMVDMLNKLATGNVIEIRELYKTNAKHTIIPKCFVACTAVNMPFSDETLFSRLLVLEMDQLSTPIAENVLQRRLKENGPAIWADLMLKLNGVVSEIKANPNPKPPTKSRLVDFNAFCDQIKNSDAVDGEKLTLGLLSMVDSQLRQLKESSQAISLLEEWLSARPRDAEEWRTFSEIYTIFSTMCQAKREDLKWKNAMNLARHLHTLKPRLIQDFGAEFSEIVDKDSGKTATKIRFRTTI